jgi:hypothetical protein
MPAGVTISVLDNYIVARWRKAVKAVKQLYGRVNGNTSSAIAFNFKADAKGK